MRRLVWLLPLALLAAACSAETAPSTTTIAVEEETTQATSTTALSITTTSEAEVVNLCGTGRAVLWDTGRTYLADCFLVPAAFSPVDTGWRTFQVQSDRFHVTFAEEGVPLTEIALVGYQESSGLDSVVESILDLEGLTIVSDQWEVEVGGWPAVTFDVQTVSDPVRFWPECHSASLGTVIAVPDGPGWRLLEGGLDDREDYGFSPCRTFRVWVVDVAGEVITMIATADQEETLFDQMPTIERLVDSMTFEVP